MRKLFLLLCIPFAMSCSTKEGEKTTHINYGDPSQKIYATYTVAGRMKSPEYITAKNYDEFQFTYIFASPKWEATDFDMTQEEVNAKYVDNFSYDTVKGHQYVNELISNIHKNENHKILLSFNGHQFIDVASVPERRAKFANMMAQFVKKFNYDGIELDWEHTVTIPLHMAFIKEIRQNLDALGLDKPLYVASAMHSYHFYTKEEADELSKYIDWINIMTYDMGGGEWGSVATHNTPMDAIKKALEPWDVFSPNKICIGLATYGFYYKGIKPGQRIPEGEKLNKYGRYSSATEIPALVMDGWEEEWDDKAQVPYFYSPDGNEFMTMETAESIIFKIDWIKEKGYKGAFWWEFHTDWIPAGDVNKKGQHLIMDSATERWYSTTTK